MCAARFSATQKRESCHNKEREIHNVPCITKIKKMTVNRQSFSSWSRRRDNPINLTVVHSELAT